MSFICIVCRDLLTAGEEEPQGAAAALPLDREPVEIVATRCGHLYHQHCLLGWFNTQGYGRQVRECPYCKTVINGPNDYQKIYPSGDEETDAIQAASTHQTQNMDMMRMTLLDLQNNLAQVNERLEGESMEHDILKVAHSELMCELNRAKADVEKLTEKLTTREDAHVLKCETLKKEKDDSTRACEILLAESKKNQEQNERLLKANADTIEELKAQVRELQALRDIQARQSGLVEKACQTVYQDTEEIKSCLDLFAECIQRMGKEKTKLEKVLVDRQGPSETLTPDVIDVSDESNNQGEGDMSLVASSADPDSPFSNTSGTGPTDHGDTSFWNTTVASDNDDDSDGSSSQMTPETKPRLDLTDELDNTRRPTLYVSCDEDESDSSSNSDNTSVAMAVATNGISSRPSVTPFAAANAAIVNTF